MRYSTRTEETPRGELAFTVSVVTPPSTAPVAGLVIATVAGELSTTRVWVSVVVTLPATSVTTAWKAYVAPFVSVVVTRLQVKEPVTGVQDCQAPVPVRYWRATPATPEVASAAVAASATVPLSTPAGTASVAVGAVLSTTTPDWTSVAVPVETARARTSYVPSATFVVSHWQVSAETGAAVQAWLSCSNVLPPAGLRSRKSWAVEGPPALTTVPVTGTVPRTRAASRVRRTPTVLRMLVVTTAEVAEKPAVSVARAWTS